jgi:hypothetical protein
MSSDQDRAAIDTDGSREVTLPITPDIYTVCQATHL